MFCHFQVKTPIPVYGIEGRYSAAIFSAANKNGALEAVEKDLVRKMKAVMGCLMTVFIYREF